MNPVIYSITTPRLLLRCYHIKDVEPLNQLINKNLNHLHKFISWARTNHIPVSVHLELVSQWITNFESSKEFVFGIFERESGALIGSTGLHKRIGEHGLEIGYWMDAAHCAKGLITESTSALVKVALDHYEMDRVEIHCSSANLASARIPQKLGFELEATLKRRHFEEYGIADSLIWTLFRSNYPNALTPQIEIRAYDDESRQYL